jgi:excisionase family DNA binding protein
VSILEAAHILGVSRATVYRLLSSGKLAAVKCGSRTLVPLENIRAMIENAQSFRDFRSRIE